MTDTVLVAGASGLVGTAAVERFLDDGHEVIAVSRRRPEVDAKQPFRHVALDLRDAAACREAAASLRGVTHVVYAAVYEKPGLVAGWVERDQMDTNLAMLRNLMEPLCDRATGLQHLSLLQGTKAYGAHLHPIRVPAREREPRDDHENFYWLHEDYVRSKSAERGWSFTIWRPQLIVGPTYGVVMNVPPIIGAYAAICREGGRPFAYPGGSARWVWEAVDVRLLADALAWAARTPAAVGETFNITNGEVFEFRDLWPAMAEVLGMEVGPDDPASMASLLPAKARVWDGIVERYSLRPVPMLDLCRESHHYADLCFAYGASEPPPPTFLSTVKLKQAGFGGAWDTEASFCHWLRVLQDRRVLPPA